MVRAGGRVWLERGSTSKFWGEIKLFCSLIVMVVREI